MNYDPEASTLFAWELVLQMKSICARYEINTMIEEAIILKNGSKPGEWHT